ncbi:HU family DNA-binding protein [Bacteroides uniformis]
MPKGAGFGSFTLGHCAEKAARNIIRNTTMTVPAHDIPHFKPSRDFALD